MSARKLSWRTRVSVSGTPTRTAQARAQWLAGGRRLHLARDAAQGLHEAELPPIEHWCATQDSV